MMKSMACLLSAIAMAVCLASCNGAADAPYADFANVVSGKAFFKTHKGRNTVQSLTAGQVKTVAAWLRQHSTGWNRPTETHPIAKATIILTLADGSTTDMSLFSDPGWQTTVVLERGDASENVIQNFSAQDLAPVNRIVGR